MQKFHHKTDYWQLLDDTRVQCTLCPRLCKLKRGQRGVCFVRQNINDTIELTTYGRSSGFCIDPIEKKPLNHFFPGSAVLSFGTAGCNLACKFCQNWDISKSKQIDKLSSEASPEKIAQEAIKNQCQSVAFTYNDPVIFHEYAIDVAQACNEKNIKSVAVTAGYISDSPREEFFKYIHAANIDLKSFDEKFYYRLTGGHLQPVLETLLYLKNCTNVWFEITTLLIPGKNDSDTEIEAMTQWIFEHLGPDVPLHFSAFHPDWKMMDTPATPAHTLLRARDIALKNQINYVYTGNIHDKPSQSTYCSNCQKMLIGRDWYQLSDWFINDNLSCQYCGQKPAGRFNKKPGKWGQKRLPLQFK